MTTIHLLQFPSSRKSFYFLVNIYSFYFYQVVHVGPGEHVRLHVGVLVQQGVEQQRGLVRPLLLAQRRVQTVEIDLERVRLLHRQRRRVCGRSEGRRNTLKLGRAAHLEVNCKPRLVSTLRVPEAGDGLSVGVGPVGAVCQIG